jgi:hypothetical protein
VRKSTGAKRRVMLCSLEGSITCVIGGLLRCDSKGRGSIMASGSECRQAARVCQPKCCARTAGIGEGDVLRRRSLHKR